MNKQISFTAALIWIIGSTFLISGGGYKLIRWHFNQRNEKERGKPQWIEKIIQTGSEREALKTSVLAEIIGLSGDRLISHSQFSCQKAEAKLLANPVIKEAVVKSRSPNAIYIDYTVRKPIAWVYEYPNVAIDDAGFLFPIAPYFSPKKLPEVYFGLAPFGEIAEDPDFPSGQWNVPLKGRRADLAIELLKLFSEPQYRDFFWVKRIDVSKAYADSYGAREIVILTEDIIYNREGPVTYSRLIRLSTKNYLQELGNYIKLREKLLEEEQKNPTAGLLKIIDLRIPHLGYIQELDKYELQ